MGRLRIGEQPDETRGWSIAIGAVLTSVGFALIGGSHAIASPMLRDIARELGIALAAVFTVSLIYELLLAQRYRGMALALVREAIATGEGNAAACERLGIRRIVQRRDFEDEHPIEKLIERACRFRLVTRSAYYLLDHHWEDFAAAIRKSAKVEICILDPKQDDIPLFNRDVNDATIDIAKRCLEDIATHTRGAPGSFERRGHCFHALDAFLDIDFPDGAMTTWELTFYPKDSRKEVKYVIELEPRGQMANLLRSRYDSVWNSARVLK